jgi:prophage regulatory protein
MADLQKPVLLRLPNVVAATGLARSTVYKLISAGQFPAPLRLTTRAVAWQLSEIEAWIASRERAQCYESNGRGTSRTWRATAAPRRQ